MWGLLKLLKKGEPEVKVDDFWEGVEGGVVCGVCKKNVIIYRTYADGSVMCADCWYQGVNL